jgi:hypothetical protein
MVTSTPSRGLLIRDVDTSADSGECCVEREKAGGCDGGEMSYSA